MIRGDCQNAIVKTFSAIKSIESISEINMIKRTDKQTKKSITLHHQFFFLHIFLVLTPICYDFNLSIGYRKKLLQT